MANLGKTGPDLSNVPDAEGRDRNLRKDRSPMAGAGKEQRGVDRDIAEADTQARTGSKEESVRNTAPYPDFVDRPFVETDKPARR
jgi:hypothetical protein